MRLSRQGRFGQQVNFLRQQFLQEGRLPFTEVLSAKCFKDVVEKIDLCWNDRIFTPVVRLWVFVAQVLSADHSCRAAVARLIAHRVSQGLKPCSSETGCCDLAGMVSWTGYSVIKPHSRYIRAILWYAQKRGKYGKYGTYVPSMSRA